MTDETRDKLQMTDRSREIAITLQTSHVGIESHKMAWNGMVT